METALPMLLFLAFLLGFGFLVVFCGYHDHMQEEEEAPAPPEDPALDGRPRFFGGAGDGAIAHPVAVVVDQSAVQRLEHFLREEMQLAELFVQDPTVEALHAGRPEPEPAASVFARLEAYLRREHQAVASFVLDPCVENLYRPVDALAPAV